MEEDYFRKGMAMLGGIGLGALVALVSAFICPNLLFVFAMEGLMFLVLLFYCILSEVWK